MNEDHEKDLIKDLTDTNYRILLLLGYATALIKTPDASKADDEYWTKYNWFMRAINDVIYLKKPLPKMP